MKNKLFILMLLVAVFCAVAFGVMKIIKSGSPLQVSGISKEETLKQAPDFVLLDIDGSERTLSDFSGKVVILDFWATWCPPCRAEIPHFVELYDTHKDEGLEIIGVSLDRNAERVVEAFAEENRINYTLLVGDNDVTDLYGGIMSIPTTFIIDRDGRITERFVGYRGKEVFEEAIKELL